MRPVCPARYRGLQLMRVGQCSAEPHELRPPGATPGPATAEYANWQSDQVESLVILQVRLLPRSLTHGPVVQWRRRLRDVQESAGSIPAGITRRSVGVPAAYVRGKDGDRVRFPDGPLDQRAARSMGGRLVCTQVIGVQVLGGPLQQHGAMVQREDTSSADWKSGFNSRWLHYEQRKVAGYGSPGRFAKPCDLRVMWVQIPCLPLTARW